jgi:hypothetical protein
MDKRRHEDGHEDETVALVKAWVDTDEKIKAFQWDAESQELRAMVCRWHKLFMKDEILMKRVPHGD